MKSISIRNLIAGLGIAALIALCVTGCASEADPQEAPVTSAPETRKNVAPQLASVEMADCSGCLDNNRQICCRGSVCWETTC